MEKLLDKGSIPFQTEGRLLQELGLRLVASPEVALLELIKNAYDADSSSCDVQLTNDGKALVIKDAGHGMTIRDFRMKWMRIATSSKIAQETSPQYHRRLTGAKGIGRFAVRYLGDHLTLESVAEDSQHGCKTRLTAKFDWLALDKAKNIQDAEVSFELVRAPSDLPTGTTLAVEKLKASTEFTGKSDFRANLLRIVSPIQGLERGKFANVTTSAKDDPGFRVNLPGTDKADTGEINLSQLVLNN